MSKQKLRVWWIPQAGVCVPFYVEVATVCEGVLLLNALAQYDLFQLRNRIKPDYANAGGLEMWCEDNGDGEPGWCSWEDEETGEDDPEAWLQGQVEARDSLIAAAPDLLDALEEIAALDYSRAAINCAAFRAARIARAAIAKAKGEAT